MSDQPSNQSNYNLPGNSHKKVEVEAEVRTPKFTKTITGNVVERKKPLRKRIAETFITGDDNRSVGHFVLFEVVLPAAKQMIVEAGSQGLERMFYGDSNRGRNSQPSRGGGYNYNRVTSNRQQDIPRQPALNQRSRATHDFRDLVLETRGEAERIRDDLQGAIETYGSTTVSDLYEFVGITGSFQDDKWGWYDLREVRIQRVRDGYMINLPRPQPIE